MYSRFFVLILSLSYLSSVSQFTLVANGMAIKLVGVIPTQGSASPLMLPSRNLSKANPRRVWRGFCPHDRRCEVQGRLLMLNMFRGISTVITLNVTSKLPPTLYLITVPSLRDGHGLQKPWQILLNIPSVLATGRCLYMRPIGFF